MPQRKNEAKWIESRQRWQINVQQDGERRTFTDPTPGKKGKAAAERKAEKWLEKRTENSNIRFQQLWYKFIADVKATTGTANYKKHEQMGRLWLLPKLKLKRASAITLQNYQDCINAAYKKGLSKKSCKNVRASITAVYNYARKQRIVMEKPEGLAVPTGAPVGERKILQPDDLKVLFAQDTITDHKRIKKCFFIHAWRFIVLTGLRRGEACGLKNQDIEGNVLFIRRSINSDNEETSGKNNNARRYIVLPNHALGVIEAQKQMLKEHGIISPWVFPDEYGDVLDPNHLFRKWKTYRKQYGIACTLHEMRHTLISIAKVDMPDQLLKRIVGHSKSMDTFGVYGHDVDGELQRAANILDDIFGAVLK
ncbi:MAG: tyrosine-type recombinase/integrase [Bacillota bacterium]